jgi:PhnB protein
MTMTSEVGASQTVRPYLIVTGAQQFIDFVEQAFGATPVVSVARPEDSEKIMHAELRIGDSTIEVADSFGDIAPRPHELHLYVDDADVTYARAVAAGARTLHAPVDQPYGDREAGVADPFGNYWYIATHGAEIRPAGFGTVTPFFHARRAAELIDFLKTVFGAREESRHAEGDRVMHAVLFAGESPIEIASAHDQWQPMPGAMHVFVDDPDAAYQRAIAAGAESLFEPADQPYGQRVGGVADGEGNFWYAAKNL